MLLFCVCSSRICHSNFRKLKLLLKDLAAKTHRGFGDQVEQGRSDCGLYYGYAVVKSLDGSGDPVRGGRTGKETEAEVVRRVFREFVPGACPRAIARRLNGEGISGPLGKPWMDSTIRGDAKRGIGMINNELRIGRLVWNRLRYVKNPETGIVCGRRRNPASSVSVPISDCSGPAEGRFHGLQPEMHGQ